MKSLNQTMCIKVWQGAALLAASGFAAGTILAKITTALGFRAMPYNPRAIDESDRSHQYRMMWLGAGGTLFTTANLFVGMDNFLSAMAFGAMAGGPMSVAFGSRNDEYLRSLRA